MLKVVQDAESSKVADPADITFADFWLLYPRHVARKNAERAWFRLTADQRVAVAVALVAWRRVWNTKAAMREDFYDYLPYPASWLNGERWTDELPAEHRGSVGHASHVPVVGNADATPKAAEIPKQVRELLAKLKGGH